METSPQNSLLAQFRRNSVALSSLLIAVTALAYNTWRNELTEQQRNVRHASFQVLQHLGELQEIVDVRYYYTAQLQRDEAIEGMSRLRGFGLAAMCRDLMSLMPEPAPAAGQALHQQWTRHFLLLHQRDAAGQHTPAAIQAEETLRTTIERARQAVLEVLQGLD